jgi:hypothetical protein
VGGKSTATRADDTGLFDLLDEVHFRCGARLRQRAVPGYIKTWDADEGPSAVLLILAEQ